MPVNEITTTVGLSTDTWVKIILFLVLHGGLILAAAWRMAQQYERRLTILETNQKLLLEIYKQQFGKSAK